MPTTNLSLAIERLAIAAQPLSDADLELPWQYGSYDEGLRFMLFTVYQDLTLLAADLELRRRKIDRPVSSAQRLLGQYHRGYRYLQAVMLGVGDKLAEQEPAPQEWPVRKALIHILEAERGFYAIVWYTLERHRLYPGNPLAMPEEAFRGFWTADTFPALARDGTLSALQAYYNTIHLRFIDSLSGVLEDELDLPSVYWEDESYPLRYRLVRFDAHLRQHTIQIEKTLQSLGKGPSEARRLLRLIYTALADCETLITSAPELAGMAAPLVERVNQLPQMIQEALARRS